MAWRPVLTGGLIVAAVVSLGVAVTGGSMTATTSTTVATTTPSASAMPSAKPSIATSASVKATPTAKPIIPIRGTVGPVAKPTSVQIPEIDVSSSLIPLGIQGQNGVPVTSKAGEVQVPDVAHPEQVGYYSLGYLPGQIGSAVLLAHVDGDGHLGAGHDFGKLKSGDTILVDRADGSKLTFTVTRVKVYRKMDISDKALFGPEPDAELKLVSCAGKFDHATGQYLDNIVVFSTLTGQS